MLFLLLSEVREYNNHWSPYHKHCSPCIANFSAVAKIDSSQYELEEVFILNQTGLPAPGTINKGSGTDVCLLKDSVE